LFIGFFVKNKHVYKNLNPVEVPKASGVLRDIQKLNLIILKKFDEICRKHDLTYWLDYGSLIGAVRHNGFIPWDDDIDVCMPIADYNKFLKIAPAEIRREFGLVSLDSKACFANMVFNEFLPKNDDDKHKYYSADPTSYPRVFIDIFPYYNVSNIDLVDKCRKKATKYFRNNVKNSIDFYSGYLKSKNLCQELTNKFYDPKGDIYSLGTEVEAVWSTKAFIHYKDEIFPLKEHVFEDSQFFVPNNWDAILKRSYGDYMTFPDLDKRKPYHLGAWKDKEQQKRLKELLYAFSK
jgi:lipopolysaccharide cholinephosphotransferase